MKEAIVAKCPKCNYERQPNNIECSRCGVVYEKYNDPELLKNITIVSKYYIEQGAKDYDQFSEKVINHFSKFKEIVRPYLHDAFKEAQEQIKNQVIVAEELLKAEESNKNLARHIASELKAQMLVREGISVKITTRKQRIGIVISLVWMVIVLVFALEELTFSAFLFFGILPVGVGWGIWWIFRTKE